MDAQKIADNIKTKLGRGTTSSVQTEQQSFARAQKMLAYMMQAKRKAEYEMWLNDQFYNGEQYATYNPATRAISRSGKDDNKVVINKIKQNARFVVMWLNRDHPQATVMPSNSDEQAYDKSKKTEHLLNYWYDCLDLSTQNKQTTLDAYKYKVGFQEVVWDDLALAATSPWSDSLSEKRTDTKGNLSISRVDPYEMYVDPMLASGNIDDARFICRSRPRSLGELRSTDYKNLDKLSGDSKLANSFLKESVIRSQTVGASTFTPDAKDDLATTIVNELYFRQLNDQQDWEIRKITFTKAVLLKDEIWSENFYPYEPYVADVQGSMLDGGGPMRDLRSPQKAFNQMMSLIHDNARVMGKINYKMPRGANVNVIDDTVGQFLEYDPTPGGSPEQLSPSGLPAYIPQHAHMLMQMIDDLGGNHSASYGKSPGSKASGELVNRLQEGDSNNLLLMRDNLDDFQRRIYKKALQTYAHNAPVDSYVRSKTTNATGRYDFCSIKPSDVVSEGDIEVVTGSKMPYSMQDRQEMLLNMKKEGIIDAKTFLKAVNLPDLDNAMNTTQLDIERALEENRRLLGGELLPAPAKGEDHATHIEVITQLIKSPEYLAAPDNIKDNIQEHYSQHINLNYQLAMIAASMNMDPIKRSENVMFRQDIAQLTPIERTQALAKIAIQSDAAAIQQRGGLHTQDPAAAEVQAQQEDIELMDGTPVQISLGDNHKVHIETHSQVMQTPAWDVAPEVVKRSFDRHIRMHMTALEATAPTPGLVPGPDSDVPNQPQVIQAPQPPQPSAPQPTNQAALNPQYPGAKRPLMPHEMIQHKGAVDNQMATEAMAAQEQVKAEAEAKKSKEAPAKKKPAPKK